MSDKLTPGKAAKQYAQEHPEFSGRLLVKSWTRKGKGGWGQTERDNTFYVTGGKAAASRGEPGVYVEGKYVTGLFNGICQVCGTVHPDMVLRLAYAPDPEAGKEIENDQFTGYRQVLADYAHVIACPDCIQVHGLDIRSHWDRQKLQDGSYTYERLHPTLAKFDQNINQPGFVLDIR